MPWEPGTVTVDHLGEERWVLGLSGEHDVSTAAHLPETLEAIFAQGTSVVIDLSAVTFIDSSILVSWCGRSAAWIGIWVSSWRWSRRRVGSRRDCLVWLGGWTRWCGCSNPAQMHCARSRMRRDSRARRGERAQDPRRRARAHLEPRAKRMSRNGIAELFQPSGRADSGGWKAVVRIDDPARHRSG
jgi:hypothetical protein